MIIQRESVVDTIEEILPLAQMNYAEVEPNQDKVPFDLDVDRLLLAERTGNLILFTGRYDAKITAYSLFFIMYSFHSKETKYAMNDVFYIDQHHRGGRNAFLMIEYAEEALQALGVDVITYNVKTTLDWGRLLEKKGFYCAEVSWHKYIGG